MSDEPTALVLEGWHRDIPSERLVALQERFVVANFEIVSPGDDAIGNRSASRVPRPAQDG
ncbi:MAG: hypothetical protein WBM08_00105 [Prochlorococcaceae cyanobacterium]